MVLRYATLSIIAAIDISPLPPFTLSFTPPFH
jgi:hypothetical protein